MLGFRKTNFLLSMSSCQCISLPMTLISARLSITSLTPSCSTTSSSRLGLSTYSRSYASPLHPFCFTPTLISFGSGRSSSRRSSRTASAEIVMAALRGRSALKDRRGFCCVFPSVAASVLCVVEVVVCEEGADEEEGEVVVVVVSTTGVGVGAEALCDAAASRSCADDESGAGCLRGYDWRGALGGAVASAALLYQAAGMSYAAWEGVVALDSTRNRRLACVAGSRSRIRVDCTAVRVTVCRASMAVR